MQIYFDTGKVVSIMIAINKQIDKEMRTHTTPTINHCFVFNKFIKLLSLSQNKQQTPSSFPRHRLTVVGQSIYSIH